MNKVPVAFPEPMPVAVGTGGEVFVPFEALEVPIAPTTAPMLAFGPALNPHPPSLSFAGIMAAHLPEFFPQQVLAHSASERQLSVMNFVPAAVT